MHCARLLPKEDAAVLAAACRRGDLQILSYCMVQWLCGRLPWEDKLQDPVYVRDSKIRYGTKRPVDQALTHLESFHQVSAPVNGGGESVIVAGRCQRWLRLPSWPSSLVNKTFLRSLTGMEMSRCVLTRALTNEEDTETTAAFHAYVLRESWKCR